MITIERKNSNIESAKIYTYEEAMASSLEYFEGNEFAANIFVSKYAMRNEKNEIVECNPRQMHQRIAREIARIEAKKFKKPFTEEQIFSFLDKFEKIIPQGSPLYAIGNPYQVVSASNCFVVNSPLDSYGGICKTDEELAQISKRRGGVGLDISNIRPAKVLTKNAARTSTGIIPFMSRFSNTIREVGQEGRRGAEMMSISICHPESVIPWDNEVDGNPYDVEINNEDYGSFKISSKYFNPNRIDFATAKYDRSKVTGANISLRLSDEFLSAVEADSIYEQKFPIDSKKPLISKKVKAKDIWDKIIYSAWRVAEPGLLFWDRVISESPADCYSKFGFRTVSCNPCGELPLCPGDSCRLLVLNILSFVRKAFTKEAYFDYKEFFEYVKIAQRIMDDIVDIEEECINRIIEKIKADPEPEDIKNRELSLWTYIKKMCLLGRRTGTGVTAVGDTLAALNIPYGTDLGIKTISEIYKVLKFGAYTSSVDMAQELGHFPVWDYELEKNNDFLNRIANEEVRLDDDTIISGSSLFNRMKKYGRRNIALLTTAPVGSISPMAKNIISYGTSSGIEPEYSDVPYTRKRKVNPNDEGVRVDEVDQNGDCWQLYEIIPKFVSDWMQITGNKNPNESPWHNNCAENINWEKRVILQAEAGKHVDHAISSTVNLPENVSVEEVAKIYTTAWKYGCKGITVYRDKCRTGVLVKKETGVKKTNAPKRPKTLDCDIHHTKSRGEDFFVLVGLFDGYPYEVFAGKNGCITHAKKGKISKHQRGQYILDAEDGTSVKDICDLLTDEQAVITRMISLSLRHGSDISFVVDQLEKSPGDMTNFGKAMARVLKKYIKEGSAASGYTCSSCGSSNLVRIEGCLSCRDCGSSKCS